MRNGLEELADTISQRKPTPGSLQGSVFDEKMPWGAPEGHFSSKTGPWMPPASNGAWRGVTRQGGREKSQKTPIGAKVFQATFAFGKTWGSLGKLGKTWKKLGNPWESLGKLGKTWESLGKLGKTWHVRRSKVLEASSSTPQ